jgi:hypothetical protein
MYSQMTHPDMHEVAISIHDGVPVQGVSQSWALLNEVIYEPVEQRWQLWGGGPAPEQGNGSSSSSSSSLFENSSSSCWKQILGMLQGLHLSFIHLKSLGRSQLNHLGYRFGKLSCPLARSPGSDGAFIQLLDWVPWLSLGKV